MFEYPFLKCQEGNDYRELCSISITISVDEISPLVCYFEEMLYVRYYVFEPKHDFFSNLDSTTL